MKKIDDLLKENKVQKNIEVCGWVKTFRGNRFISLNDGSCIANLQCVIDFENTESSLFHPFR